MHSHSTRNMYPCHSRVDGADGVLYDSNGNICSTWESLSDTNRHLIIAGVAVVGSALLGLGIFGLVRYVRVRNRRRSNAMISERPPTAMAQQGYIQHRQSKSMVSTPMSGSRQYKSHGGKSRSGSLSSNQTPSPSPLRNAQYTRPYSREYEGDHLEYQQSMRNAAYAPIPSARPGDVFAGHHNAYPSTSQPYPSREEMEYLRDLSRSGSMMDIGSTKV